uniref:Putative secreted protein n=1 Tax=Ixodes ricinus TaxID=34613 RepID=A0A6B0UJR6_IXORI
MRASWLVRYFSSRSLDYKVLLCFLVTTNAVVSDRIRTTGKLFDCLASSASFLLSITLRRHTNLERVRISKAWWKARGVCWKPGVRKRCPAILIFSATVTCKYVSAVLVTCR